MSNEECRYIFKFVIVGDIGNIFIFLPYRKLSENHVYYHNLSVTDFEMSMSKQLVLSSKVKLLRFLRMLKSKYNHGIQQEIYNIVRSRKNFIESLYLFNNYCSAQQLVFSFMI